MKIQSARKMIKKKPKMTSFMARRRLVKRLVKHAVSRAALKKFMRDELKKVDEIHPCVERSPFSASSGVLWGGEFVPLTSGFLFNSDTLPYYLPVLDNHGFLLGQFSQLDDLLILEGET